MKLARPIASAAALGALLTFAACGGNYSGSTASSTTTTSITSTAAAAPTDTTTIDPTFTDGADEVATPTDSTTTDTNSDTANPGSLTANGAQPDWALPVTNPKGAKLLATVKNLGGLQVGIYQVAVGKADSDSMFVDPKTNKNILLKGAPVVYFNFIITNQGSKAIELGSSMVNIDGKYEDWKYIDGMPGSSHDATYIDLGINPSAIDVTSAAAKPLIASGGPYELAPGQAISYGTSYLYEAGEKIDWALGLTPQLNGKLDFAHQSKQSVTTAIK